EHTNLHPFPTRRSSDLLLRVSTNSTGPSTKASIVTSPGAPASSVPSFGSRSIARAGLIVAIATTSSSENPMLRNLLITDVKNGRSEEHTSEIQSPYDLV